MSPPTQESLSFSSSDQSSNESLVDDENEDEDEDECQVENEDENERNGILDDLLAGPGDSAGGLGAGLGLGSLDKRQSVILDESTRIRTRQKRRGSFVAGEATGDNEGNHHRVGGGGGSGNSNGDRHKLFEKRWHSHPLSVPSSTDKTATATATSTIRGKRKGFPKTELEAAVLADCIQNHFLLACNHHVSNESSWSAKTPSTSTRSSSSASMVMVGAIASRFEKTTFRKNEVIFREGDDAEYLYVLYRGEVLIRGENENHDCNHASTNENEYEYPYENEYDSEYKILGELELLTNASFYRATAKAMSDPCVLFRLGKMDFRDYFIPNRGTGTLFGDQPPVSVPTTTEDPPQQHIHREDDDGDDERVFRMLKRDMPQELSSYFFPDETDEDRKRQQQHHERLWKRLLSERRVRGFRKGDVLVHKSTPLNALVLITEGRVRATENTAGGRSYEDLLVGPGQARLCLGWQSVLRNTGGEATAHTNRNTNTNTKKGGIPMTGTVRAETDGQAIVVSQESFQKVFCHVCCYHDERRGGGGGGDHHNHNHRSLLLDVAELRRRQWKRTQLQQITVFKDSGLDSTQINGLIDLMHHCEYGREETILRAGQRVDAAMYFVREGAVRLERNKGRDHTVIERGGYFGEKNMLLDQNKSDNDKHHRKRSVLSAIAVSVPTKVDVLYLEECRTIVDTRILGLGTNPAVTAIDDSLRWADLARHKLIGTGSFGQVWLVSNSNTGNGNGNSNSNSNGKDKDKDPRESKDRNTSRGKQEQRFFALKVQSKYSVLQSNDANRLIAERNIMACLRSPFLLRLFNAFQDDYRLYMVTSLLRGGQLESIVPETGVSESRARFYAAGILEGLTHMHRRHIIHRDVKPESILLDSKGYPVLIDFGFAKYVPDKTYTFCGSPMFMAPEIILYQGHNKGVDHWSWAVLVYRLVTGKYPFYKKGVDEMALYKRICKGAFEVTGTMSAEFRMLMISVLYPDPTQRLGSRANGWRDIFDAPWFASFFSPMDLKQLRKQALPAPFLPPTGGAAAASFESDSPGTSESSYFIHQSSSTLEDLFDDDICGKIADDQQHIFGSFGSHVCVPIGDQTTQS